MIVCVDAGHGMSNRTGGVEDSGAEAAGVRECDVVLGYALALGDALARHGIAVFQTRKTRDEPAPLGQRVSRAQKAGCHAFVSLHLNAADAASAEGLETLYRMEKGRALAVKIQDALLRVTGFRDRGVKVRQDLAVLKFGPGPSILIELGFVTNASDRAAVQRSDFRARAVAVMAETINAALRPAKPEPVQTLDALNGVRDVACEFIWNHEAQFRAGKLVVYSLPKGDAGGAPVPGYPNGFEVAGVCNGYHPHEAGDLAAMVVAGRIADVKQRCLEYYGTFTDFTMRWTDTAGVEIFLRDTGFNRGPRGVAKILQAACGAKVDGLVGPKTLAAVARIPPRELLTNLRAARESYERAVMKRDESSRFWAGLHARWDDLMALCLKQV